MRKIVLLVSSAIGAAFLSGCAGMFQYHPYAREVNVKPGVGGVIALHQNHRPEDMTLAEGMMSNNCGAAGYQIKEEGEVAVGTQTYGNTSYQNDSDNQDHGSGLKIGGISFGGAGTNGSASTQSETTQIKEWQITYSCKNTASTRRGHHIHGRRTASN